MSAPVRPRELTSSPGACEKKHNPAQFIRRARNSRGNTRERDVAVFPDDKFHIRQTCEITVIEFITGYYHVALAYRHNHAGGYHTQKNTILQRNGR